MALGTLRELVCRHPPTGAASKARSAGSSIVDFTAMAESQILDVSWDILSRSELYGKSAVDNAHFY